MKNHLSLILTYSWASVECTHPGQVTSVSQGRHKDQQPHTLTSTPIAHVFGLWKEAREPMQAQGEHAKTTQEGPRPGNEAQSC